MPSNLQGEITAFNPERNAAPGDQGPTSTQGPQASAGIDTEGVLPAQIQGLTGWSRQRIDHLERHQGRQEGTA